MQNRLLFFTTLFILIFFQSCSENDASNGQPITDEEAIEQAASALQSDFSSLLYSSNLFSPFVSSGRISSIAEVNCDTVIDTLIDKSYSGAKVMYDFLLAYSISFECNSISVPTTALVSYSYTGEYTGQFLSSSLSSLGSYSFSQLLPTDSHWLLNGESTVEQEALLSNNSNKFIISSVYIKLEEILLDKSDATITSGSGTIMISGETSTGELFNFDISLSIVNEGQVVLEIGQQAYVLNITTGEITKG